MWSWVYCYLQLWFLALQYVAGTNVLCLTWSSHPQGLLLVVVLSKSLLLQSEHCCLLPCPQQKPNVLGEITVTFLTGAKRCIINPKILKTTHCPKQPANCWEVLWNEVPCKDVLSPWIICRVCQPQGITWLQLSPRPHLGGRQLITFLFACLLLRYVVVHN